MSHQLIQSRRGIMWPVLVSIGVVLFAVYQLRTQGRLWTCACGYVLLWSGNTWSADNSQHWFDPYSFTHVLHGFILCGALALLAPRLSLAWRFCIATGIEALWEIVENSAFVIDHYRTTTAALGYTGDTIINSLGDLLSCGLGFVVARYLGARWAALVFVATEVLLTMLIKDSLIINIIMLIYPIEALKNWQMQH